MLILWRTVRTEIYLKPGLSTIVAPIISCTKNSMAVNCCSNVCKIVEVWVVSVIPITHTYLSAKHTYLTYILLCILCAQSDAFNCVCTFWEPCSNYNSCTMLILCHSIPAVRTFRSKFTSNVFWTHQYHSYDSLFLCCYSC